MKKTNILTVAFLAVVTLVLSACSTQTQSGVKKVIKVATDSDTAPFTYKENKAFKGYDIGVVKAIFKDSKEYKVEFVTTAFDSILTGVDADRYQIAANDFNYNEERSQKYLFSDPTSHSNYAITSAKGTSYDSLDDLSGKKTEVISGSNYAQVLEKWNKNNPDKEPIEIKYAASSTGLTTRVQHIENGTIDFILYDAISSNYLIEDQGFNLTVTNVKGKVGGENDGLEYLLFADTSDGKALQKFVNKRLKSLKEDGTLAELSQTYFGGDFVSSVKS